ncbi:Glyco-hydro-79C domain-containing protein [Mycena indigotica]|uniref:Glyco-hydro-79C domain-containing protein n=1 Tax=Mycena indigotica TaxID=2126181 RepID=A0A8H6SD87_9AGAR|nr:Glyco-hydro-79C domain-containing protein [Mycena indigotica]KAF7297395.1 Glyco-hydro-79C domain-containing protein [Mycena indigotica]
MLLAFLLVASALLPGAKAGITVYSVPNQVVFATTSLSGSASAPAYTGVAAYNPTTLIPPPVPTPAVPSTFNIQLNTGGTPGASIEQSGDFIGFSVEMSVSNQVLGKNSTHIQVPFLNLLGNIVQRAGSVRVRVGGNSQESATLVDASKIPDGRILQKNLTGVTGTTQTPPLEFSDDLLYMMSNISSLVNVKWFLGIPWFVTKPFDLAIVGAAERILGDKVIGYQASNEPDLYIAHGHRPLPGASSYGPFDYFGEFSDLLTQLAASGLDPTGRAASLLIGPSVADATWTPEMVFDTGYVDAYSANLAWLSVEKYPTDNCAAAFNTGAPIIDPQSVFQDFLNHTAHTSLLAPYLNSTAFAQSKNKKMLMFETNSASCGGFGGISDAFGAALWGLDYALQMAHSNFSGAMFHVGGQNVFYNPFTSPPTNQSSFHQWTIGPIYYSALVMAEAMGATNHTQVLDLQANNNNEFTPAYAIYESGKPARVALFNYITDSTGKSDVTAVISVADATGAGGATPTQVRVKYLQATSVAQKGSYTWAGQTFGGNFASDGRLTGTEDIKTVDCDATAKTCSVKVPAPGFALVFLGGDDALTENKGAPSQTYSTTALTKTVNTATINPSVLATSNGHGGVGDPLRFSNNQLGSTSHGSVNTGMKTTPAMSLIVGCASLVGAALVAIR